MNLFTWGLIIFLIAVNALYVAAEFAAVSVRRSRIRQMAEAGHPQARRLLPFLEDARKLDRYIAGCQIGITLSSLILGAYGQVTLADWLAPHFERRWGDMLGLATTEASAAMVVLVLLTGLQMILGELIPKSLALTHPERTALYTLLPMRWSLWLYSGFIAILNGSGHVLLKLFGLSHAGHRHIHSPEEIALLITESRDGGVLKSEDSERLQRALKLGSRPVRQLMRSRIAAVDVATPVDEILRYVAGSPYTRLPAYRGTIDHIIGLLHAKELFLRHLENAGFTSVEQVLRPILVVPETLTTDRLLAMMRERHIHQAVVIDEFGGASGLVALDDILAEVLGELADELKEDEPRPQRLPDGRIRLPGVMRLDQAETWLGLRWQGEAETLGGHVMGALGHIPKQGECLTIEGVEVVVERMDHLAIRSLLARPVLALEEEASLG